MEQYLDAGYILLTTIGQIVLALYIIITILWGLAISSVMYLALFTSNMNDFLVSRPEMYALIRKGRHVIGELPFYKKVLWVPLPFIVCFVSSIVWPYILIKK